MKRARKSMLARAESTYRSRHFHGAEYFTSRRAYDDLTVVVKRFPQPADVTGPDFVLVHGIGVSSRYYHPAAAELAKLGTVWLVDLPGYGAAPNPRRDVSIADHAGALAAFLHESALIDPVLVGHSMGSQVVSRLAVDSPDVATRIVLMAPTMPAGERTLFRGAWRLIVDGIRNPIVANVIVATDYFFRCGMPYFFAQSRHLFGDHIEDRLAEIHARTLVLVGDHDLVVPRPWAQFVADGIPGSTMKTVRGPHLIMFSDPVGVAACIVEHAEQT
ncbi:MAG: alpha/beta hydrolase [Rhodoglobus sp.]